MNFAPARSTAINSRVVAIAGLSSEFRGLCRGICLRVAQHLERGPSQPEVAGGTPRLAGTGRACTPTGQFRTHKSPAHGVVRGLWAGNFETSEFRGVRS